MSVFLLGIVDVVTISKHTVYNPGVPVLAGLLTTSFVLFRMAVFDGYFVFKLSPLKIDNPSFAHHMKRKLRRETIDSDKRLEIFARENGVVLGSFAGAMVMGQLLH